jgi:hypothetical protein
MRFFSWIASCFTSWFEEKTLHLSDEVSKTRKRQKDPDESKDLFIGHESQVYPPYRIYFIR